MIKSRVMSVSDLSLYNLPTNSELLLNNSQSRADLFRFYHTIDSENTLEVFSFFQLSDIALNNSRQIVGLCRICNVFQA